MSAASPEQESHRAAFAELPPAARPWLDQLRRTAMDRFAALGYPTTRHEDWKYTNLAPLVKLAPVPAPLVPPRRALLEGLLPAGTGTGTVVLAFLNGRFAAELSSLGALPEGATVSSLATAVLEDEEAVRAQLSRVASLESSPFTALNTAFLQDGAFVRLRPGVVIAEPLVLAFLTSDGGGPACVVHPRTLVVAERGSQASVVEVHAGSGRYLSNAVTELSLGDGAVVQHVRVQREGADAFSVAAAAARQDRSSALTSHVLALGGSLARSEVSVLLEAEGASCTLNGLYVGDGRQHLDQRTLVDHAGRHCESRQLYKGVLGGRSRGVFNGTVIVRRGAQGTDARQSNHNLLLSEDALADTKPQLEIHADDVKCSHGATIGQLDGEALFYLRSRGLPELEARSLLVQGFVSEVLDRLPLEPWREHLAGVLRPVLSGPAPGSGA